MPDNKGVVTRSKVGSEADTAEDCSVVSLHAKVDKIIDSLNFCHQSIDEIKVYIAKQDAKIDECQKEIQALQADNASLHRKNTQLESEVNNLQQYSHRNNLVISGIPEDKGENIYGILRRLATAISFPDWSEGIVDIAHRMGKQNDKGRLIIVKFLRRTDRNTFLQKRKVKRNLTAQDLGYPTDRPIYVNESLTPTNLKLLDVTRKTAKDKGYSYVWTSDCNILVRKANGTPARKITAEADLSNL